MFSQRDVVKGELVILVEGKSKDDASFDAADLTIMLEAELQSQSLRDAVKSVVENTGLPRRDIYKLALQITDEASAEK
jgi:16S rRNA (cytidine1402-2'-O)-methyltransferase